MNFSFGTNTASSLAEVLAGCVGDVELVPPEHLPLWLPDLGVPRLWVATAPNGTVTRMLLRGIRSEERWDACEVINLYRIAGAIPAPLVHEQIARTLRDSGARAIQSHRVDVAAQYNVVAAQAAGLLSIKDGVLRCQYTDFAVNTASGGALIEQIILVAGKAFPLLENELTALSTELQRALLASIDRASPSDARSQIPTSRPSQGEP
ncbi:hypothetical protein [Mycobacterium sp. shizuoka-1]|uniref:hypothetical protein n=1 Tax=Mycobacterium sp. shizuoka-1 TaxID=2039281 RepID=UPI000C06079A|nr:hypothetical protein [Mycobacterium sp. shizuoka-1]GAY17975.1 hypothetical protein MSZK_47010 [Mycobacterium sp. shizuoka-1]